MKYFRLAVSISWAAFMFFSGCAHQAELAANAPMDKPVQTDRAGFTRMDSAIAPLVAEAKRTYPSARERFANGLPSGEIFFIVTRLSDSRGAYEQVFVRVGSIENGVIDGTLANEVNQVRGYRMGQKLKVPEENVMDWLIAKPDGSEEGNIVGKFLDSYHP